MINTDANAMKETFRGFNYNDCVDILGILVDQITHKNPKQKRLMAFGFDDKAVIIGGGPWQKKIGALYQAWFTQQIDATPPEFTIDELGKGMIGTLFDSFTTNQLAIAITYLTHRLNQCQSTSLEKAHEMPRLSSSEKLPDEKKSSTVDRSSEPLENS